MFLFLYPLLKPMVAGCLIWKLWMGDGKDRGGLIAGGQLFGYDTILGFGGVIPIQPVVSWRSSWLWCKQILTYFNNLTLFKLQHVNFDLDAGLSDGKSWSPSRTKRFMVSQGVQEVGTTYASTGQVVVDFWPKVVIIPIIAPKMGGDLMGKYHQSMGEYGSNR